MAKKVQSEKVNVKNEKKGNKLSELRDQMKALREEVFNLKLDNAQRKLKNTTSLTLKRKELARLLTAARQLELAHEENI